MDKDFLIQLTNNLYRLTLLFPKKEPLRYKMRELADEILAHCLTPGVKHNKHNSVVGDLEVLDGFFEVAKAQNWVSPEEILKLQENYSKLKEEFKTETDSERTLTLPLGEEKEAKDEFTPLESSAPCPAENQKSLKKSKTSSFLTGFIMLPAEENSSISERQEKILAFLREQGRAQVWQIKHILPEVTKRTLRRDFENLLKKDLIKRIGERNDTFYQIKTVQA
ncbi:MAG: hypothetical protein LiPW31_310 [Microgenomates group bacterium LiPW_31]|nr:MAG: hypothetical protein LiPW31_310 [Microgenomates group bacterium LiPW_31]